MSKRARAALVAGIAAAALTFTPVGPASAAILPCPVDHMCTLDYFNSPDKTHPVGRTDQLCDGTTIHMGERTPWTTFYSHPCN
ncbi:MAG TPA: hypothetical protein H9881_03970 [Candidatus Stackebrandtia excrementipullorum]|nr:hypothetical protein [Candidatus Stackebrandtia excrementipullorum]